MLREFSDSGWWPILWCMLAATNTERFEEAQRAYDLGFPAAEQMGWPIAMAGYLVGKVSLVQRLGHLDLAETDLERLEKLAPLVPFVAPYAILIRAGLDLEHGSLVEAEKGCRQMDSILELFEIPGLALWTLWMRARLELSSGRLDEACEIFEKAEQIAEKLEITEPCVTPWWVPAVDGYRAAGRFSDLQRIVEWLDRGTAGLPCRWPRACATAGRALISEANGEIDSATKGFDEAFAQIEGLEMPLDRAELLIWQGRFLHRQDDLPAARRSFSAAYEIADSRAAGLLADIAGSELRRAGGRIRRDKRRANELTSRQFEVANLASMGLTSNEIARDLRIARKTVDSHLDAVYRQWGLSTRRDLMRMRFTGEPPFDQAEG
jgi:DNA-binding CsgD family transcriptional regulator